jgi:hypothetical protein
MITLSLSSILFNNEDYQNILFALTDVRMEGQIIKTTSLVRNIKTEEGPPYPSGVRIEHGVKITFPSEARKEHVLFFWRRIRSILNLDCAHILDENGKEWCIHDWDG